VGCIYRRGKNYWIKYYRNGKPYIESTHSDKKEVAKKLLSTREGEIAQGRLPGICFEKVIFRDLLDDYLTDFKINGRKSLLRAEGVVRVLKEEFGAMKAVDIDTPAIKRYVGKRQAQDLTNATINRELAAIKRTFNLAFRCTPPRVPHVPYIPMLKERNVRKGFIEQEAYLALREALPEYLKPVLTFAYFSGWRRSEILGLTWRQVNLRDGIVRLEPGDSKNEEGRTLYLEPELQEILEELYRKRRLRCPYVFHLDGNRVGDFRKAWGTACSQIGIPGLLFHDLRRSAVRNMVRAGIPERVAMTVSGHKTRNIFDRYNITSQDDLREAAKKRHEFYAIQAGRLHFSYILPQKAQKVTALNAVTS